MRVIVEISVKTANTGIYIYIAPRAFYGDSENARSTDVRSELCIMLQVQGRQLRQLRCGATLPLPEASVARKLSNCKKIAPPSSIRDDHGS